MPLTRGARYRLPVGNFMPNDFVIKIDPPNPPVRTTDTAAPEKSSQHEDDDRFGRHRGHLLEKYGYEKLKFEGHDDFMDLEDDQILVGNVYGWYEVSEWPDATKQLKKTERLLAELSGQEHKSSELSSDSFDDEDKDQTFEADELPVLHSDTLTIEDDIEGAVHLPSPRIFRPPTIQYQSPEIGLFTPAQARQRRLQAVKSAATNILTAADSTRTYNEKLIHHPYPTLLSAPTLNQVSDSATQVLARLDERLQIDIQSGIISPTSKRTYSKKERYALLLPTGNANPAWVHKDESQSAEPRYRTKRETYNTTKKRKSREEECEEEVATMSKKGRMENVVAQIPLHTATQEQGVVREPIDTAKCVMNIYPPVSENSQMLDIWPQYETAVMSLPVRCRVRVRFIPHAFHVLPNYQKQQGVEIDILVNELERKMRYHNLATPDGRKMFEEHGIDAVKSHVAKCIIQVLTEHEEKTLDIFKALNVKFILPTDECCPQVPTPPPQQSSVTGSHIHGFESSATNFKPTISLPNLINRQLTALLEIVRIQTSLPTLMHGRQSVASAAARRQYESNMHLAALAWQVHYFEAWVRQVERRKTSVILRDESLRYWKDGREVVDLLTGIRQRGGGLDEDVDRYEEEEGVEEGAIARALREAKDNTRFDTTPNRPSTSHDRLQAVVNAESPDMNLQAHNQLQGELRLRQQRERQMNRCSQQNVSASGPVQGGQVVQAAQPYAGPTFAQPQTHFQQGTKPQFNSYLGVPREQWDLTSQLGGGSQMPQMLVSTTGSPQGYAQTRRNSQSVTSGAGARANAIPIDPALQAFDSQQAHQVYGQHASVQQTQTRAREIQVQQQDWRGSQMSSTTTQFMHQSRLSRVSGYVNTAAACVPATAIETACSNDDVFGPVVSPAFTVGEISTSPGGTAGVRLSSSPLTSDLSTSTVGRARLGLSIDEHADQEGNQYTPSDDKNNSDRSDSGSAYYDGLPTLGVREALMPADQNIPRRQDETQDLKLYNAAVAETASGDEMATFIDTSASTGLFPGLMPFEGQSYCPRSNAWELGTWIRGADHVSGDFGAEGLGATGETEEEATVRGEGDGFGSWRRSLL